MRRLARVSVVVAIVGGVFFSVAPADAAPTYTLSPTSGPIGSTVHVRGNGCQPGGMNFGIDNGPGRGALGTVNADGTFELDYVIPEPRAGEQEDDSTYGTSAFCDVGQQAISGPTFRITGPAYRFDPSTAAPGATVRVSGLGCYGDPEGPESRFSIDGREVARFRPNDSNADAQFAGFSFSFVVPRLAAGAHNTSIRCIIQAMQSPSGTGGQELTGTSPFTVDSGGSDARRNGLVIVHTAEDDTVRKFVVLNANGSVRDADLLTADGAYPGVRWHPSDPSRFAFVDNDGGPTPVVKVATNGQTTTRPGTGGAQGLAWVNGDDLIVWRGSGEPTTISHADGTSEPFATRGTVVDSLDVSRSGRTAYVSSTYPDPTSNNHVTELHVVEAGADRVVVGQQPSLGGYEATSLSWCPDETIIFNDFRGFGVPESPRYYRLDPVTGKTRPIVLSGRADDVESLVGATTGVPRCAPDGEGFFTVAGVNAKGQGAAMFVTNDGRVSTFNADTAYDSLDVQSLPAITALPRTSGNDDEEVAPSRGLTDAAARLAHASGRSPLAVALRPPKNISTRLATILINVLLAIGIAVLVFPAVLFNSTYEKHYDEIHGWFRRKPRAPREKPTAARRWTTFIAVALATAVLAALLDPKIKADRATAMLVFGVGAATILTTLLGRAVSNAYLRETKGRIKSYPGALGVGALTVAVSRVVHFLPGYLYGIIGGFDSEPEPDKRRSGWSSTIGEAFGIALGVGAWFAWQPIADRAAKADVSLGVAAADAVLASIASLSFQSLMFSMIPIKPLPGEKLWRWNKAAWAFFMTLGAFSFLHVLAHPAKTFTGSVVVMLALFAGFGVASIAFWAYFRFRKPKTQAAAPEPEPEPEPDPEPDPEPPTVAGRPRRDRPLRAPGR